MLESATRETDQGFLGFFEEGLNPFIVPNHMGEIEPPSIKIKKTFR
jgi:hypothetical protein